MTDSDSRPSIPLGYCQCGCGRKTTVNRWDDPAAGYIKGIPRRFVRGHQFRKIRYTVDKETGCWLWEGRTSENGYGLTSIAGKTKVPAHRFLYERYKGPVPDGLELHHRCVEEGYGSRLCCNPEHLEPVTHLENGRRSLVAKLTVEIADEIRRLYATGHYSQRNLARRFGVSQRTIWRAVSGGKWL